MRRLVVIELIITVIRSGRLRWYGHVMRKGDKDWVKKCMEYRVEGRRPVGRPRKTWLESVEADMAELEIDKEDDHDRKKWRSSYEDKVQLYQKTDYKPIIYILRYIVFSGIHLLTD